MDHLQFINKMIILIQLEGFFFLTLHAHRIEKDLYSYITNTLFSHVCKQVW